MVVEDERPNVVQTTPSPELVSGSPCKEQSPGDNNLEPSDIKVVPLSELSNIFTNGLPKDTPDKDSEDDVSQFKSIATVGRTNCD
ncbi:hypothetical protein CEXT_633051 [Caerostris extrusa]|uniref:Uncharacterized protein n=1 Tax=Caerostris extrusa TaxID=172846 RepID=A0AAV4MX52_CAEEX|nr:hypothetical protein CEXT_633051 [Caerostris extrusa]